MPTLPINAMGLPFKRGSVTSVEAANKAIQSDAGLAISTTDGKRIITKQ